MSQFRTDLRVFLNTNNRAQESNTPDFILARYLEKCLESFEDATSLRAEWFGSPIPTYREPNKSEYADLNVPFRKQPKAEAPVSAGRVDEILTKLSPEVQEAIKALPHADNVNYRSGDHDQGIQYLTKVVKALPDGSADPADIERFSLVIEYLFGEGMVGLATLAPPIALRLHGNRVLLAWYVFTVDTQATMNEALGAPMFVAEGDMYDGPWPVLATLTLGRFLDYPANVSTTDPETVTEYCECGADYRATEMANGAEHHPHCGKAEPEPLETTSRYCDCPELVAATEMVDGVETHTGCGRPMAAEYETYCSDCGKVEGEQRVCTHLDGHSWTRRPVPSLRLPTT